MFFRFSFEVVFRFSFFRKSVTTDKTSKRDYFV